jgi:hypothetical protein
MASESAYDTCDFAGSTTLAPVNAPAVAGQASYYLPCAGAGQTYYLSCSVSDHCAQGQKVRVEVSPTERVFDLQHQLLLHSDSLSRVMALLGHRTDPSNGWSHLERGYQTEANANVSLEMIWCLEAHCPESARDWDPSATPSSCLADIYNLGGFVSRSRPIPQYEHAEAYYRESLAHEPDHCPTLGYLAELYLMTGNASAASSTALHLCSACGGSSPVVSQIEASFALSVVAAWPCAEVTASSVTFAVVVAGTIEAFDETSFKAALAANLEGVNAADITLGVSAASVRVDVTVRAPSVAAATSTRETLATLVASPSTLSAVLGVTVESVPEPPRIGEPLTGDESDEGSSSLVASVAGAIGGGIGLAVVAYLFYSAYCKSAGPQEVEDHREMGGKGRGIRTGTRVSSGLPDINPTPGSTEIDGVAIVSHTA